MSAAIVERSLAFIGAIVVGIAASFQLRADWSSTGLHNNVTKLLLGLMAFGCVLVVLAALGVLGGGG